MALYIAYSTQEVFICTRLRSFTFTMQRILSGRKRKPYGRSRSLIRHIGSLIPMKSLPQFYLTPKFQQSEVGTGDFYIHDRFQEDDSGYVRSCGVSNQQSQLVPSFFHNSVRSSTPVKEVEDEKFLALQHEVQKLQAMVHELWMCHQATLSSDSEETAVAVRCVVSSSTSLLQAQLPPPPPPLPPPPPPPLPLSLIPVRNVSNKSKANSLCPTKSSGEAVLSLGDIMKDVTKVKLRPVERTPGGNPKRRPVTPSDPSNVLAAVLKKRFAAIHSATRTPKYQDNFHLNTMETCKPPVVVQLFT
ncbi:mitochondrial fission regulator 1 isoform X2 [Cryptotermes secundus]|uniref:mitochondrial fission regulator 1 isoform X2 n=1 Tax=Cryptotermes secundus TaxID=105785 RepID=UPI001454B891|nr:mitochondrial fission regulator 1 isoform X2 [Cryptotermes secundus]